MNRKMYKIHLLHSGNETELSARRAQQLSRGNISPRGLFSNGFQIIQNSILHFKI